MRDINTLNNNWIENALLNEVHISINCTCISDTISNIVNEVLKDLDDFNTPADSFLSFEVIVKIGFVASKKTSSY